MRAQPSALLLLLLATAAHAAAAARGSKGCGAQPPVKTGTTTARTITVDGLDRSYRLRVPASYHPSTPMPIIVSHHGWTCSAAEDEKDGGLSLEAEASGFIVAYLNGYDDNSHGSDEGWGWKSWNGAGTVFSDTKKPGCYSWGGTSQYCYESCASRSKVEHDGKKFSGCDKTGCDWTTCVSSNDFNTQVLDLLESELCVDVTREYATGQSNGAIYTYHLGVSMSERLAAIAPISGSFMHDYITGPTVAMPVLDCTGTQDQTVPVNDTSYGKGAVSNEGWIYSTTDDIFASWEPANGCDGSEAAKHWPTSQDGVQDLYCWGKQCGASGEYPVIRCAWNGGHNYFGNEGKLNSKLVWEFLSQFSRPSHLGMGRYNRTLLPTAETAVAAAGSTGQEDKARRLEMQGGEEEEEKEEGELVPDADTNAADQKKTPYYGNPKNGCRDDETAITFSNGHITGAMCSPQKTKKGKKSVKPTCKIGGYKQKNGCPAPPASSASVLAGDGKPDTGLFPTCLAVSADKSKAVGEEFHCVLTCDRAQSSNTPDPEADSRCPDGAVCLTGQLRLAHVGVCVYTD